MTEIVDNAVQFAVTLVCALAAGHLAMRRRKQAYYILICYYAAFAMGILYWLVYDIITSYTPKIFYVSDLCWVAGYLFLLMLVTETAGAKEKKFYHPASWISAVLAVIMTCFFCQWGDCLENVIWCGIMGAVGWFAIRGCIWASRQHETARRNFHIWLLLIIAVEYSLWTVSCFWVSNTLSNPYFWFDFMLTACAAVLLPVTVKAVEDGVY